MHAIRPATLADAAGWARVVLAASPLMVTDARAEAHEIRTDPADARRVVATVHDEVVGVARFRAYDGEDHAAFQVLVDPAHRRRRIGSRLLEELEVHLAASGKPRVSTIVEDDDASRIASAHWGFTITRPLRMATVDPRTVADPGPVPDGVRVVPVADVGPRRVWENHQQVARDDPSGLTLPVPYDVWLAEWSDPRSRPDLGRAVLVDGELAAYSLLGAAGERAWSAMTGTLPAHRGRGYALLAKQHVLRAAAAAGITSATTGNDAANAPMLAVNARLGYLPAASPAVAERRGAR